MKAYLRIVPYIGLIYGLLALVLLLSFSLPNSCQLANSNSVSIKEHTEKALEATTLEKAKYHAYKALKDLQNNKNYLNDCGCEPALKNTEVTENNLKKAVRSNSLGNLQMHLKEAIQNTMVAIDALEDFSADSSSSYGNDLLVMNTKEVINEQGGILLNPQKQLQQRMEESLLEFETSLNGVVQHVDCEDAFSFINKIIGKSNRSLEQKTLTDSQRQYHTEVKNIALNALKELNGCPTK